MTTNVIETMTQAIRALRFDSMTASPAREQARAALAAIEAAGYRVVPVEPTEEMAMRAAVILDRDPRPALAATLYAAMLDAAPKVTE